MSKIAVCIGLLLLSVFSGRAQTGKSDYFVFINVATQTGPDGYDGQLFDIEGDSITVMNLLKRALPSDTTQKNVYDTVYYSLSPGEKENIIATIKSIDTLKSPRNPCIDDGLRFFFSCGIGNSVQDANVINAYDEKIFYFVDIINRHVPKKYQIIYKKNQLIDLLKECETLNQIK